MNLPIRLRVALLFTICALASTSPARADLGASRGPGTWTVMVYLDADNNLEDAGIADFNEMEQVGSTAEVNVVVQMDRTPGFDRTNGDWTTARRYLVEQDSSDSTIGSTLLADIGEVNMGHPDTLVDFVTWAATDYPADHYLLIIWDHGEGWRKVSGPSPLKGVAYDDTSRYDYLSLKELAQALADIRSQLGRDLDILACDACLMQMVEVAYELRANAGYFVGSAYGVPWDGYPYNDFLAQLVASPTMSASALCSLLVDTYVASYSGGSQGFLDCTLSAVRLSQMDAVAAAADALALALMDGADSYCQDILTWWSGCQMYDYLYRDLGHFAQLLSDNVADPAIAEAAAAVVTAIDAAIVAEAKYGPWMENSSGLSFYYPPPTYYEPPYGATAFGQATNWDDFLAMPMPCDSILPDAYEPDDTPQEASTISCALTQTDHWFDSERDDDWAEFTGEPGLTYCIGTKNLGMFGDTFMYLYAGDGTTLLDYDDDSSPEWWASLLHWSCSAAGTYYVCVQHYWYYEYGLETKYDLFVKQQRFSDVSGYHWAFHQIDACCNACIVSGYGGYYQPASPVSRDQMAVFIARAMCGGEENVPECTDDPSFVDVPANHWAFNHIEYAVDAGIVGGYEGNTYQPTWQIDRGQMAVFVARALCGGEEDVPDPGCTTPPFPDVPCDSWARKHIQYIAAEGITYGYEDGLYHPEIVVTRDQMAVYICRAFDLPM